MAKRRNKFWCIHNIASVLVGFPIFISKITAYQGIPFLSAVTRVVWQDILIPWYKFRLALCVCVDINTHNLPAFPALAFECQSIYELKTILVQKVLCIFL